MGTEPDEDVFFWGVEQWPLPLCCKHVLLKEWVMICSHLFRDLRDWGSAEGQLLSRNIYRLLSKFCLRVIYGGPWLISRRIRDCLNSEDSVTRPAVIRTAHWLNWTICWWLHLWFISCFKLSRPFVRQIMWAVLRAAWWSRCEQVTSNIFAPALAACGVTCTGREIISIKQRILHSLLRWLNSCRYACRSWTFFWFVSGCGAWKPMVVILILA